MKALKVILDVLVVGYVILTVLLLAGAIDENAILDNVNAGDQALILYKILVAIGAVVMLARVLMSSLYIADMKHDRYRAQLKINQLKANLYEKRQAFRSSSYKEAPAKKEAEAVN